MRLGAGFIATCWKSLQRTSPNVTFLIMYDFAFSLVFIFILYFIVHMYDCHMYY